MIETELCRENGNCKNFEGVAEFTAKDSTSYNKVNSPDVYNYNTGQNIQYYLSSDTICAKNQGAEKYCKDKFNFGTISELSGFSYDDSFVSLDAGRLGVGLRTKKEQKLDSIIDVLATGGVIDKKQFALFF